MGRRGRGANLLVGLLALFDSLRELDLIDPDPMPPRREVSVEVEHVSLTHVLTLGLLGQHAHLQRGAVPVQFQFLIQTI